jgi:XTP/dITP diphosphohydrolase
MKTKLLLATSNSGKLREFKTLLKDLDLELISPVELGIQLNVVEDGQTYAENAARKALAYARETHLITLADDSGLEVEALNGAPGLYSARFSDKPGATDADRRHYLLEQLNDKPQPWKALFRCVLAITTPDMDIQYTQGTCEGEIIPQERGTNGFGYDPIFFIPQLERTMAELSSEEKNMISHRARAVIAARPLLTKLLY